MLRTLILAVILSTVFVGPLFAIAAFDGPGRSLVSAANPLCMSAGTACTARSSVAFGRR